MRNGILYTCEEVKDDYNGAEEVCIFPPREIKYKSICYTRYQVLVQTRPARLKWLCRKKLRKMMATGARRNEAKFWAQMKVDLTMNKFLQYK